MDESLLVAQSIVLTHKVPELASSIDDEEVLEDLSFNADLYLNLFVII